MSVSPRNLDELKKTATLIAAHGGDLERLARLAELVGTDREREEVGRAVAAFGSGVGQLDTCMVVLMLPAAEVDRLLPVGLERAPNSLSPVGKHPVFVQLSHDVFTEFGGMDYDEIMLGVPFVQLCAWDAPRRGPFIYMPRLYLDADLPRWLGNYLYGYEKLPALIDRDFPEPGRPGHYRVLSPGSGAPLLTAALTSDGPRGAPGSFAAFAQLRQLLEMPTISQAARIWDADAFESKELSPYLASNLVYGFDDPDAWLEPVRVELTITPAFTPAGVAGTYAMASLQHAAFGAFRTSVKLGVALPSAPATLRYPLPPPAKRQRVLVLGGGPAACAAAYWLARQRERYEVKVYTQGFRLGGKCAAGRNPRADLRIEEHGLHAFLGFYENAFRTVRSVYETAGIPVDVEGKPFGGAFIGSSENGLMIARNEQWKYFKTPLPTNDRVPGYVPQEAQEDDADRPPVTKDGPGGLGAVMVEAFRHAARRAVGIRHDVDLALRLRRAVQAPEQESLLSSLLERVRDLGEEVTDAMGWDPVELVQLIVRYLEDRLTAEIEEWLAEGCDGPLGWVHRSVRILLGVLDEIEESHGDDDQVWYQWMSLSTVLTAINGIIEDRVTHLDQLDGEDMWAWFRRHGLDPRLLPDGPGLPQGSPAIVAVYETLFAHGHDTSLPRELAAGVGLRWFFLSGFGYAGYPAYEFKYSCPQTLLTPYYEALTSEALAAEIHFFHRVTELVVEGEGDARRLVGVKLQRQATVRAGSAAYRPFLPDPPPSNPADQPPWPNEPNYEQLVEGERLRTEHVDLESLWSPWPGVGEVELRAGRDFDLCILGIPLAALPPLCGALARDPRWAAMFRDIAVTETISMQLWFTEPEAALYAGNRELLTAYVEPEPSMGDLTHLIKWEGWKPGNVPKFLAYHTGSLTAKSIFDHPPFTDHGYPAERQAWWRAEARRWLQANYAAFYERAPREWTAFEGWLALPSGAAPNADRFDAQYFNAGSELSDLYVLSQPKGMAARMGQMESGVAGLYLCGDWTRTDMNCGCVEAATQSGMLCARGISGHPVYVWHSGF
jgi:uncharacterized protein with NAD-binding domain and iron-sulfur cluster